MPKKTDAKQYRFTKSKANSYGQARRRNPVDWAKVKTPEPSAIDDLFEAHGIRADSRDEFDGFLADLVDFVRWHKQHLDRVRQHEIPLSDIRNQTGRAIKSLAKIIKWTNGFNRYQAYKERPGTEHLLSLPGWAVLSKAAQSLAAVIDPLFLANYMKVRPASPFTPETGEEFVRNVVEHNPDWAMRLVLTFAQSALEEFSEGLNQVGRKGGPRPREIEPNVLMNLAFQFERLGCLPTSKVDGDFHAFAMDVVEAMDLPNAWVASHLRAAINEWKRRRRKNSA